LNLNLKSMREKKVSLPKVTVKWNRRGDGAVEVQIYHARVRKWIRTGVRVDADQWSQDYGVVNHVDAAVLNKQIQDQVTRCKAEIGLELEKRPAVSLTRNECLIPESQKMKVDRSEASWLDWMREQIEVTEMAEGTRRHHRKVLRSLESFGKMKRYEDVKPANIMKWLNMVGKRTVKKVVNGKEVDVPVCQTTKRDYFKVLKKYVAIAQELRLVSDDALKTVKCERGKSKPRVYLTDEEIERWLKADIASPCLSRVRDLFAVEMGTGFAFQDFQKADFTKLEKVGKYWTYQDQRTKTMNEFVVVILPWAYKILQKWDFILPELSNQKYNKYLKEVAELVGIDKHVTSHVGRHTYATYLLNHGVSIEAIAKVLGHTNIKTTQIYARMNKKAIVDAFKDIV